MSNQTSPGAALARLEGHLRDLWSRPAAAATTDSISWDERYQRIVEAADQPATDEPADQNRTTLHRRRLM